MTASESVKCFLGATTKKQEREKMNTTKQTRELAMTAIVAALYAVLTLAIAPIAYGAIQFRLSEVMTLLAFYDKKNDARAHFGLLDRQFVFTIWDD